jgi:hypothetical protein
MARGGYRPGSGRPKSSQTAAKVAGARPRIPAGLKRGRPWVTPLEYMLAVVNDPNADLARRDRMAVAAAPFTHPRVAEARYGKKDAEKDRAEERAEDEKYATPATPPKLVINN